MTFYSFRAVSMSGESIPMSDYKDKVVLVVNTASTCGFTPQFKELEELYREFKDEGFVVLGFPCNQFNKQDKGSNDEINEFCQLNYGVTFPMFQKIEVNGPKAHSLFVFLQNSKRGFLDNSIKWNFTKFLVDRNGKVVKRFAPAYVPKKIKSDIQKLLKKKN